MQAAVEARTELQPVLRNSRDVLYLDLALENVVRAAAERGAGGAGAGAATFVAPLLQNLALSLGDNEEVCYCLKAWQELPDSVRGGKRPNKDDALQVRTLGGQGGGVWGDACLSAVGRFKSRLSPDVPVSISLGLHATITHLLCLGHAFQPAVVSRIYPTPPPWAGHGSY